MTGSVQSTGPSADASLAIPLSGPKDAGTLYVEGRKSAGVWRYSVLEVEVESTGRRIPLLRGAPRGEGGPPQVVLPSPEPSLGEPPSESTQ